MAGRPTRQHISRFGKWSAPKPHASQCTVKGASVLKHTAGDLRAVAETTNPETGAKILLCADCLSYVEAYQWAIATGVEQLSEHKLWPWRLYGAQQPVLCCRPHLLIGARLPS